MTLLIVSGVKILTYCIVNFELYIKRLINTDHKYTGSIIRELCEDERVVTHNFLNVTNCFIR